jgi:hypothetical protein
MSYTVKIVDEAAARKECKSYMGVKGYNGFVKTVAEELRRCPRASQRYKMTRFYCDFLGMRGRNITRAVLQDATKLLGLKKFDVEAWKASGKNRAPRRSLINVAAH